MYIPSRIHLDFETFAQTRNVLVEAHGRIIDGVDLVRDGVFNYSRHPLTGCYLFGTKLDSLPTFVVQLWKRISTPIGYHWQLKTLEELLAQYPLLISFLAGIAAGVPVVAHNSAFERLINNNVLRRYYGGWPELKLSQQVCTLARANAMSLPAGLENLANVLGLQNRKSDSTLMKLLAMSAPNVSAAVTPEALEELGAYCAQDVETEAEIDRKLYPLSPLQQELWILDQEINGRGIPVDVVAIRRALKVVDAARELANARLAELTGGAVKTAQQNAALAAWLQDQGHPGIASVAAFTLKSYGEDMGWTPADKAGTEEGVAARELIEEVLELREVAAKSSVAKLQAVLDQLRLTDDARVRHQYTVFGAGTGRWTGRGFQPQNMQRFDSEGEQENADKLFAILNDDVFWGSAETPGEFLQAAGIAARRIQEETGQNAIKLIGKCMRIFVKAPEIDVLAACVRGEDDIGAVLPGYGDGDNHLTVFDFGRKPVTADDKLAPGMTDAVAEMLAHLAVQKMIAQPFSSLQQAK